MHILKMRSDRDLRMLGKVENMKLYSSREMAFDMVNLICSVHSSMTDQDIKLKTLYGLLIPLSWRCGSKSWMVMWCSCGQLETIIGGVVNYFTPFLY